MCLLIRRCVWRKWVGRVWNFRGGVLRGWRGFSLGDRVWRGLKWTSCLRMICNRFRSYWICFGFDLFVGWILFGVCFGLLGLCWDLVWFCWILFWTGLIQLEFTLIYFDPLGLWSHLFSFLALTYFEPLGVCFDLLPSTWTLISSVLIHLDSDLLWFTLLIFYLDLARVLLSLCFN